MIDRRWILDQCHHTRAHARSVVVDFHTHTAPHISMMPREVADGFARMRLDCLRTGAEASKQVAGWDCVGDVPRLQRDFDAARPCPSSGDPKRTAHHLGIVAARKNHGDGATCRCRRSDARQMTITAARAAAIDIAVVVFAPGALHHCAGSLAQLGRGSVKRQSIMALPPPPPPPPPRQASAPSAKSARVSSWCGACGAFALGAASGTRFLARDK